MTIPWVQVHTPQPAAAALTQSLSPAQEKIRQRILAERQNNRNRISQILKMEMVKDIMMMDAEDILEMDAGVLFSGNEEEFVFDTLPIVWLIDQSEASILVTLSLPIDQSEAMIPIVI